MATKKGLARAAKKNAKGAAKTKASAGKTATVQGTSPRRSVVIHTGPFLRQNPHLSIDEWPRSPAN